VELQSNLERVRAKGLEVAAISYDSVAVLKNFSERRGITFPLLSDPDSKIIRDFGILNEQTQQGTTQYGIPYPGTYLLDRAGRVTEKYFEDDYTQRYTSADILVSRFGEDAGAVHTIAEGKHLRVSVSASNAGVRSGQRISLVLDVQLGPRLHVYAPGVKSDYIPIEWRMKESPALIMRAATYPNSKQVRLEAIKETVPVYQDTFRLVRDVTVARDAALRPLLDAEGKLSIEGSLRYQACDDKICYPPETVPVRWTLQVEGHDRERAPAELQRKGK
jgi:AhpC/TSA family/Disulphide bond corrector protein DsbC